MHASLVSFLARILKKLAQLTMAKFKPAVIGVTGSVGKTSTKHAIAAVLGAERRVRFSPGSHNNHIGLPLTILGEWSTDELKLVSKNEPEGVRKISKLLFWVKVIVGSLWRLLFLSPVKYPEILVLEYGADRPGDLKYLLHIARPSLGVITAVGDIPVHVEFYSGPDEVAREKARLIEQLPAASFAVLNADDEAVMNIQERTRAHIMTFGFDSQAQVRISGLEHKVVNGIPVGLSFKLESGGSFVPVRLPGMFGKAHAYAVAAAAAVGLIFGLNLVKIAQNIGRYDPPKGRMRLIAGIKDSQVLDDSYNASPMSMHAALETLKTLPAKRKIAVLGDMLEIGTYSIQAHERLGALAGSFVHVLVTVGPRAKFIAEGARKEGMDPKKVLSFDTAQEAADVISELIHPGDLVVVKASRAIHCERVVNALAARRSDILVS